MLAYSYSLLRSAATESYLVLILYGSSAQNNTENYITYLIY